MNVTTKEIAALLGVSRQAINKRAKKESWIGPGTKTKGGGNVYSLETLPESIQQTISKAKKKELLATVPVSLPAVSSKTAPPPSSSQQKQIAIIPPKFWTAP